MTSDSSITRDASRLTREAEDGAAGPGVLLLFSAGEPLHGFLPLEPGKPLTFGRGTLDAVELRDACMSRRHASITWDGERYSLVDHGSRNGTYVDGVRVEGTVALNEGTLVRFGETLALVGFSPRSAETRVEVREGVVVGPTFATLLGQVTRAAHGGVLHVTGETGSGKEIVARFFHRVGAAAPAPFVAVNCAAIPEGVAERLLFGTKRGAFSGANADAPGYLEEANGGTLFLDEVGELDLNVQAKLLRVLETKEVLPLGAARPRRIELRLCSATHVDLREAVAAGRFRSDLFYRLGRPRVALPPLRERREEIPFLIDHQLRMLDATLVAQGSLVEAALLRPWPGNVRELLAEIRDAAYEALAAERAVVRLSDLASDAGAQFEVGPPASGRTSTELPDAESIARALREASGRVATAARALGLHRTQLRRYLERHPEVLVESQRSG